MKKKMVYINLPWRSWNNFPLYNSKILFSKLRENCNYIQKSILNKLTLKIEFQEIKSIDSIFSGPGRVKKLSLSTETSVIAPDCNSYTEVLPKRVRLINFIAKNRIIQRMFLLAMVGWISIFIYNSKTLDTLVHQRLELFLPTNSNQTNLSSNAG